MVKFEKNWGYTPNLAPRGVGETKIQGYLNFECTMKTIYVDYFDQATITAQKTRYYSNGVENVNWELGNNDP